MILGGVTMRRRICLLLVLAGVVSGVATAVAHEKFRIIGTLTKVESKEIGVKKKDGKTTSISMDKQTKVLVDKKKGVVADLKVGQSVVVDAYGDDEFDLLALDVRIVPTIAPKAKSAAKDTAQSAAKKQ
jgi:hypothetical protein